MIGIIGALEEEISMLKNDMEVSGTTVAAGCEYICGRLNGQEIVTTLCGMGKVNAASCAATLIEKFAPGIIINTGVGGGLDDSLKVCDIVIADDVIQYDYNVVSLGYLPGQVDKFDSPFFKCDPQINAAILKCAQDLGCTAYTYRFGTGDHFVDDPAEKKSLIENYGARVCEMETGAIAQVCALHNVRFSSIRTISDSGSGDDGAMQFQQFLKAAATQSVRVTEELLKTIQNIL